MLVYTVRACANSVGIPPAPVTVPYTIVHQLGNELSYKLASQPILLRPSTKQFRTSLGVFSVPIYALGLLTEQREVKECRFATWRYIIIRRGCGCQCGLGAEKSFSFLRERVDPRLHTYLADEVRETVLVVDRYVRDCLKPSGLVAFHPCGAELRAPDNVPHGTLTPAKTTAVLQRYSETCVDTKH